MHKKKFSILSPVLEFFFAISCSTLFGLIMFGFTRIGYAQELSTKQNTAIFQDVHPPQTAYPHFDGNPCIDSRMKKMIKPYLLPRNHHLKPILDIIFATSRPLANTDAFAKAGFVTLSLRPFSFMVISKHPYMPGYLQKVYLDTEKRRKSHIDGWQWIVQRCQGAENIRQLIQKENLRYFSVPDKWIYPVPPLPNTKKSEKNCQQPLILIVEDMDLVSQEDSHEAWKTVITTDHLDELYVILSNGFASCHLSWNIPYTKNGKFACIDTEHPKRTSKYEIAKKYLSDEMNLYWDQLVKNGGNPAKK